MFEEVSSLAEPTLQLAFPVRIKSVIDYSLLKKLSLPPLWKFSRFLGMLPKLIFYDWVTCLVDERKAVDMSTQTRVKHLKRFPTAFFWRSCRTWLGQVQPWLDEKQAVWLDPESSGE